MDRWRDRSSNQQIRSKNAFSHWHKLTFQCFVGKRWQKLITSPDSKLLNFILRFFTAKVRFSELKKRTLLILIFKIDFFLFLILICPWSGIYELCWWLFELNVMHFIYVFLVVFIRLSYLCSLHIIVNEAQPSMILSKLIKLLKN